MEAPSPKSPSAEDGSQRVGLITGFRGFGMYDALTRNSSQSQPTSPEKASTSAYVDKLRHQGKAVELGLPYSKDDDDSQLATLLQSVRTEVKPDEAVLHDAVALAGSETVLDALLVGPSKSGKSTVVNALLGQVVCPASMVTRIFPVAFRTKVGVAPSEDGQLELRVPVALRTRLEQLMPNCSGDPNLSLPEDGLVHSCADFQARLDALNRIGRCCLEALISDPISVVSEPVEVVHYVSSVASALRRWRVVDFPGSTERFGSTVSRFLARLLEWHMQKQTTGVVMCVVAKDQVGNDSAMACFSALPRGIPRPFFWLVNKVDSEDDYHDLQEADVELRTMVTNPEGGRPLYVSAAQVLAHTCAESLQKLARSDCKDLLPVFQGELHRAFPREAEAIVKALVPAASKFSKNWKQQYAQALTTSWQAMSQATQFPNAHSSEGDGDDNQFITRLSPDDGGHSDNASLRPSLWSLLSRAKARLVLQSLEPPVRKSLAALVAKTPHTVAAAAALHNTGEPECEDEPSSESDSQHPSSSSTAVPRGPADLGQAAVAKAAASVRDLQNARNALQERVLSASPQTQGSLASTITDIASGHMRNALQEVHDIAEARKTQALAAVNNSEEADGADAPVAVPIMQQVDVSSKLHACLEATDGAVALLHRSWITQDDVRLEKLCDTYSLVEHVPLVSEVERQTGTSRGFESAIFAFFSRIHPAEATDQKDWFKNTSDVYLNGIRAAAPNIARKIVDSARTKLVQAQKQIDSDLTDAQWDLAEVDSWHAKLTRVQTMLASMLWLRAGLQSEPLTNEDISLLDPGQQALLLEHGHCVRTGESLRQLWHLRPEWLWWMAPTKVFDTALYRSIHAGETAPASPDEVLDAARQLAYASAVKHGWPRHTADEFVRQLQHSCDRLASPERAAAGLWTASTKMCGKDLLTLASEAFGEDDRPALLPAVRLLLALQPLRLAGPTAATSGHATTSSAWSPPFYKGSTLPSQGKELFQEGLKCRCPCPMLATPSQESALATAHQEAPTAAEYDRLLVENKRLRDENDKLRGPMKQAAPEVMNDVVLYTIKLSAGHRADAYLLGNGANGQILFAPYAGFRVGTLHWQAEPTAQAPHVIELHALSEAESEKDSGQWPLLHLL